MSHPMEKILLQRQENPYNTTVHIPKEISRSSWLTRKNASIAAFFGAAAIGTTVYLVNKMFTETITDQFMSFNNTDSLNYAESSTEPLNYTGSPFNYTNPSIDYILEIYNNVLQTNLSQCTPGFKNYWENIERSGETVCDYVRYAINLFNNECPETPADCKKVANVMKDCQDFMSKALPDC